MDYGDLRQFLEALPLKKLNRVGKIIERINKKRNKAFVRPEHKHPEHLCQLLQQNWWWHFEDCCNDYSNTPYYVYFHADPQAHQIKLGNNLLIRKCPTPFYVGMGQGARMTQLNGRSKFHTEKVTTLRMLGETMSSIAFKVKQNLTECKARQLESKLIFYFGCKASDMISAKTPGQKNAMYGGKPCLLNQQYEPTPDGLLVKRKN